MLVESCVDPNCNFYIENMKGGGLYGHEISLFQLVKCSVNPSNYVLIVKEMHILVQGKRVFICEGLH